MLVLFALFCAALLHEPHTGRNDRDLAANDVGFVRQYCERTPAVKERAPNQDDAREGYHQRPKSGPEHIFGPTNHLPLGLQVAFLALVFALGVGVIFLSFYRIGNAIDRILDGSKRYWFVAGLWFGLGIGGALLASGVVTFTLGERVRDVSTTQTGG